MVLSLIAPLFVFDMFSNLPQITQEMTPELFDERMNTALLICFMVGIITYGVTGKMWLGIGVILLGLALWWFI